MQTPLSTGDALPVATQDLLAVPRAVAIALPHADIPTSETPPAFDIHANPRTPVTFEAVPASVDIHIDIGAATLPGHALCLHRIAPVRPYRPDFGPPRGWPLLVPSPGILTFYAGSLVLALLLHFL